MPISVVCSACGTRSQVPDAAAGRKGKCRQCGTVVSVPASLSAAQQRITPPLPPTVSTPASATSRSSAAAMPPTTSPGLPVAPWRPADTSALLRGAKLAHLGWYVTTCLATLGGMGLIVEFAERTDRYAEKAGKPLLLPVPMLILLLMFFAPVAFVCWKYARRLRQAAVSSCPQCGSIKPPNVLAESEVDRTGWRTLVDRFDRHYATVPGGPAGGTAVGYTVRKEKTTMVRVVYRQHCRCEACGYEQLCDRAEQFEHPE